MTVRENKIRNKALKNHPSVETQIKQATKAVFDVTPAKAWVQELSRRPRHVGCGRASGTSLRWIPASAGMTTRASSSGRVVRNVIFLFQIIILWALCVAPAHVFGQEAPYKLYVDPAGRFSFEYPATMKLQSTGNDEVKIYHPAASFRVSVFVEQRRGKSNVTADVLLAALKKRLTEEMKNVSVLGEGKLAGLKGSQGWVAVSFTDKKGVPLVQMVQYYVAEDCFLQMTISDRPEGFKNLEPVIRKIHQSLRILKPKLK